MLMRLMGKELRETAWMGVAALAVYLCFVLTATSVRLGLGLSFERDRAIPLLNADWLVSFAVVGACLASGLGLWQTVGESARGTYQFLLHRPASRNRLLGTKLLVGGGVYLVVALVPLLLYAWWAAVPGTHANQFVWWMSILAWQGWLGGSILYLGAFLAGLRPGRWHGTRLLPLVAVVAPTALCTFNPLPWAIGALVVLLLDALLVANILFVARTRDFS